MTAEIGRTQLETKQAEALRKLVAGTRYVLFDFDGPICDLFWRYPAAEIARAQVDWLDSHGLKQFLRPEERFSPDPHGVLSAIAERYPESDLVVGLEENLTLHELKAAGCARPAGYADPLIRTWVAVGARLAIVTNNSARTVLSYLRGRGLDSCFTPHIYGRTQDLSLLKPHPETLNRALRAMGADKQATLMIGDAVSDYDAAQSAGVGFLGYARNPVKEQRLLQAGVRPERVLHSLKPLLTAVRDHS